MSKISTAIELISDACKIADSKNVFKEFLNDNDEFLSSNSWGSLLKYLSKKMVQIEDLNEAYYFTMYTSYLNTFKEALEHYALKENNFSLPHRSKIKYDYQEFEVNTILNNMLKKYFDTIFQTFLNDADKVKIQRYINHNIKYNYFKVLQEHSFVLEVYIKHINSSLGLEEQNNFKKELYKNKLENEYYDIVMADINGLSLNELYMEANFRVYQSCFKGNDERVKDKKTYDSKFIDIEEQSIHTFVENIFLNNNESDLNKHNVNTVFIAGQPGQGKSSFTKKFCNDIINNNTKLEKEVILIKLKNLERPKELIDSNIKDIVTNEISSFFKVKDLDNYIVVFDGLDELAMKTGLSTDDIDKISQNIARTSLDTIVTTRHGYVNFDTLSENNIVIIELKELSKKQQISWLNKYKQYAKVSFDVNTINKLYKNEDENKHILELIGQIILLHMIVNMDIKEVENLSKTKLYEKFFYILIKRKWEDDKHTLNDGLNQTKYKQKLINMLKELAFTIYNSDYEYIQKHEFKNLKSVQNLQEFLGQAHNNNESIKTNLKGMMVSFYFKEVKNDKNDIQDMEYRNEDYSIEFLHKSLIEYMVALNIYETLKKEFLRKDSEGEYIIDDGKSALEILWNLSYQKEISNEIRNNIMGMIQEEENDYKDKLFNRLYKFLNYFLDKDFIYEVKVEKLNIIDKAHNVFFGFWTVYASLESINNMPKDDKRRQKLCDILLNDESFKFIINNLNVSNLQINYKFLAENIDTMDFTNTIFFSTTIYNFDFHIGKLIYNKSMSKIDYFSNSTMHSIKFMDATLAFDCNSSVFYNCKFKNVKFNPVDMSFRNNIFKNCTFDECDKMNIKELNINNDFINCTLDGEKI